MPKTGAVFAVTLTVNVADADALILSVTVSVKVELVAVQEAATLAVTLPAPSIVMLLSVTPVPVNGVKVKLSALGTWSGSEMVAIWLLVAALPCCRVSGPPAVMVGGVLTDKVKAVLVVAPQLSVAVTVTV